jgi:hypothetical protein
MLTANIVIDHSIESIFAPPLSPPKNTVESPKGSNPGSGKIKGREKKKSYKERSSKNPIFIEAGQNEKANRTLCAVLLGKRFKDGVIEKKDGRKE